jgi:undecaprenyl pyrophosphate synthase
MLQGMHHICHAVQKGILLPEDVTENLISQSLYTAPHSQVDLLVRTSGKDSQTFLKSTLYTSFGTNGKTHINRAFLRKLFSSLRISTMRDAAERLFVWRFF